MIVNNVYKPSSNYLINTFYYYPQLAGTYWYGNIIADGLQNTNVNNNQIVLVKIVTIICQSPYTWFKYN